MRKRLERFMFGIVGAAALTVCAVGCGEIAKAEKPEPEEVKSDRFDVEYMTTNDGKNYTVITDSQTGYEYLVTYDENGLIASIRLEPAEVPDVLKTEIEEVVEEAQDAPEADKDKPEVVSIGQFKVTAYCSCERCCGKWAKDRPVDADGNEIVYTASGAVAKQGRTIAVDPSVIPYGTMVFFAGQAWTAEDTGGSIDGSRIDVYFDNHNDAKEWGVQYHDVSVQIG